ncbi:hypothetical protein LPJ53_000513 [Coemansia erecta]|uniref:Uncharacterized protein n=1 Tax=Coemansia erecta TaxID=147472 RepID=A0A9W7Y5C1_9FUNG|nr:hypothetical protein LPJ53_000513 [Coemansia erecta]
MEVRRVQKKAQNAEAQIKRITARANVSKLERINLNKRIQAAEMERDNLKTRVQAVELERDGFMERTQASERKRNNFSERADKRAQTTGHLDETAAAAAATDSQFEQCHACLLAHLLKMMARDNIKYFSDCGNSTSTKPVSSVQLRVYALAANALISIDYTNIKLEELEDGEFKVFVDAYTLDDDTDGTSEDPSMLFFFLNVLPTAQEKANWPRSKSA